MVADSAREILFLKGEEPVESTWVKEDQSMTDLAENTYKRENVPERRGAGGVQPSERRSGNLFEKHTIENPGEGYLIQT